MAGICPAIGLHVGHLRCCFVHGLLLGQLLGALQLEVGVAAGVFVELAVLDVDDAVDDRIRGSRGREISTSVPLIGP